MPRSGRFAVGKMEGGEQEDEHHAACQKIGQIARQEPMQQAVGAREKDKAVEGVQAHQAGGEKDVLLH